MEYQVILKDDVTNYALVLRGKHMEEYAVVFVLNEENNCWNYTCGYYNFGKYTCLSQTEALFKAVDEFRSRTTEGISYMRMSEIAEKTISSVIDESMYTDTLDNLMGDLDLTDKEKEYFCLPIKESEDE